MAYQRATSAGCAGIARSIRTGLEFFDIKLSAQSDLAEILRELDWLGDFPPTTFQPDAAFEEDSKRAARAFLFYEQAVRIAASLSVAPKIPGAARIVSLLRKRLNRLASQDLPSLDHFFELDIAQRIHNRGHSVSLAEPDIVLSLGDDIRVGLACKRPRAPTGLSSKLKQGSKQVKSSGFPGFIIVSMEAILHSSGDDQRPVVQYAVENATQLREYALVQMEKAIQGAEREIEKAFDRGIWGILFCGFVTGIARRVEGNLGGIIFDWVRISKPNSTRNRACDVLDDLIFREEPLPSRRQGFSAPRKGS